MRGSRIFSRIRDTRDIITRIEKKKYLNVPPNPKTIIKWGKNHADYAFFL